MEDDASKDSDHSSFMAKHLSKVTPDLAMIENHPHGHGLSSNMLTVYPGLDYGSSFGFDARHSPRSPKGSIDQLNSILGPVQIKTNSDSRTGSPVYGGNL